MNNIAVSTLTSVVLPAALGMMMAACAGQIEPPGGPPDITPPGVVRTEPDTNAVNVRPDRIVLEFSEYVDRRTVEEAIFISPYVGELSFDWSGTEVEIRFPEPLRDNITYVLTVGTDVKDQRANNRMAAGFTLAFATGDSIDRGAIGGRVVAEAPEGVMIFAYSLAARRPDTLNPSLIRPEYVTQTGKDGKFLLSNLAPATYRVFAVRDAFRDLMYDRGADDIGVAPADVTLGPLQQRLGGLTFRLSRVDTTAPFPTSVNVFDRHHLLAKFSEPIDSASVVAAAVSVTDTVARSRLTIALMYHDRATMQALGVLLADTLQEERGYQFSAIGLRDKAGNVSDSTVPVLEFTGTARPDTLRPTFTIDGVGDTSRGVPPWRSFEVRFSEPVLQGSARDAVRLLDSLGREVITRREWVGGKDLSVIPRDPLRPAEIYRLTVVLDSIVDCHGNRREDSTASVRIRTLDLRSTGLVAGRIQDEARLGRPGPVAVTVTSVGLSPAVVRTAWAEGKTFALRQIPEGRYILSAFVDSDSSGDYTFGRAHPFRPAERFTLLPDTLRVRARWSVENVIVPFP
jgi:hypothetical protein